MVTAGHRKDSPIQSFPSGAGPWPVVVGAVPLPRVNLAETWRAPPHRNAGPPPMEVEPYSVLKRSLDETEATENWRQCLGIVLNMDGLWFQRGD